MAACAVLIALGANLGGCIGQYGFPQRHPTATPAAPAPAAGGDGPLAVKLQVPHRQDEFFVSRLRALTGRPVVAASAPPRPGASCR